MALETASRKINFMSKNNKESWTTKYGSRRVRHEAPTLAEAIAAAQGLSDEPDEQVEIAAALIGLPRDQVRSALLKFAPTPKSAPTRKTVTRSFVHAGPTLAPRTIVVERIPARRAFAAAHRTSRPAPNGPRQTSMDSAP